MDINRAMRARCWNPRENAGQEDGHPQNWRGHRAGAEDFRVGLRHISGAVPVFYIELIGLQIWAFAFQRPFKSHSRILVPGRDISSGG